MLRSIPDSRHGWRLDGRANAFWPTASLDEQQIDRVELWQGHGVAGHGQRAVRVGADGFHIAGSDEADAKRQLRHRTGAACEPVAEVHLLLAVQRSRGESEKGARQQRDETVEEGRGIAMDGHGGLPMLLRSSEKSR